MRLPFSTAVYEHAARFTGRTPWEVSRDPELLFEGHRAAWLEYGHTPVVVGIDIYNLEAEAYGARVDRPDGAAVPAISQPLVRSLDEGMALGPYDPARDGRIPMALETARRLAADLRGADVRIPVAGPFSIAFNLRGINGLLEDLADRPGDVARWLDLLAGNQAALCRAAVRAGVGIAFFESAAAPPLLSPRLFREVELPALKRILGLAARETGRPVPCIMGGNTFPILDEILSTGTGYLVANPETDQAAFVERVARTHPEVSVRVNMRSAVVAGANREAIRGEVERIVALARAHGRSILGTGALPYETPPENVKFIKECMA